MPLKRTGAPHDSQYCYKSWKRQLRCPACGRTIWQNLNFLGQRIVFCDGLKITRERAERQALVEAAQ